MAHVHAVGDFSSYQEFLYESLLVLFVSSFSKASRMKNKKKYHFNFSRVSRILELQSLQIKFLESGINSHGTKRLYPTRYEMTVLSQPLYIIYVFDSKTFKNAQKYPRIESGWDDLNQRLSWLLILFVDKVFYCSDK